MVTSLDLPQLMGAVEVLVTESSFSTSVTPVTPFFTVTLPSAQLPGDGVGAAFRDGEGAPSRSHSRRVICGGDAGICKGKGVLADGDRRPCADRQQADEHGSAWDGHGRAGSAFGDGHGLSSFLIERPPGAGAFDPSVTEFGRRGQKNGGRGEFFEKRPRSLRSGAAGYSFLFKSA
jgi:hypothetical protein